MVMRLWKGASAESKDHRYGSGNNQGQRGCLAAKLTARTCLVFHVSLLARGAAAFLLPVCGRGDKTCESKQRKRECTPGASGRFLKIPANRSWPPDSQPAGFAKSLRSYRGCARFCERETLALSRVDAIRRR